MRSTERPRPRPPRRRPTRWPLLAAPVLAALALGTLATAASAVLEDFGTVLPQLPSERRAELQQRAGQWHGWSEHQRAALRQRAAAWDALPAAERNLQRERYHAWRALAPSERAQLRAAAADFRQRPPDQQRALRAEFDGLDATTRRGWLLGPWLGADYPALQPLLAQLPAGQHAPMLRTLRAMTVQQRRQLAVLAQRTPPQDREALRRELLSTAAGQRQQWLWQRLDR